MIVYADSSFVVSLYIPDVHSPAAAAWAAQNPNPVLLGYLGGLEVVNAIRLRVFRRERTVTQATQSIQAFDADVAAGVFRLLPVPHAAWSIAERLSQTYSHTLGTRSLDILQVAIALSLHSPAFLTFDRNQAARARAEGLQTSI